MILPVHASNTLEEAVMHASSCSICTIQSPEIFPQISPSALRDFRSLGTCRSHQANEFLIREGFPSDYVLIPCRGRVKLIAWSPQGRFLSLRVVGPGEILDLASLLSGPRQLVTAQTLVPSVVKYIPRTDFIRFRDTCADGSRTMAHDYDGATRSPPRLTLPNSAAKLAAALLDWAHTGHLHPSSAPADQPISFPMPFTHEELGSRTGISRQTVTRILLKFRSEGLIEQTREHITLKHPDMLQSRYC